jgi:hypothetical protein
MTKEQEHIFKTYLKTLGYVVLPTKADYSLEEDLQENNKKLNLLVKTYNTENENKKYIQKEKLDIEEIYKNETLSIKHLPKHLFKIEKTKVNSYKLLHEKINEHKICLDKINTIKHNIYTTTQRISELSTLKERILELTIDFGPNVRKERGKTCTICGCNDAHPQTNPYVSELENRKEIIVMCDECFGNLSDAI